MEEAGDGGEEVGVQSDSDAEGGEESGEAEASRKVLQPRAPTAEERRIHGLTHCPYRSWCEHCVRGQSEEYPHRSVVGPTGESTITRVIMDCCYFAEGERRKEDDHTESKEANVSLTTLVMKETLYGSVWAYALNTKSVSEDPWVADHFFWTT